MIGLRKQLQEYATMAATYVGAGLVGLFASGYRPSVNRNPRTKPQDVVLEGYAPVPFLPERHGAVDLDTLDEIIYRSGHPATQNLLRE